MVTRFPKPVIFPSAKHQTASIIFCHGLNAPTPEWQRITACASLRDHVKLILPQAPKRTISYRPGKAALPAWYDVMQREIEDRVKDGDEDEVGMQESWDHIDALVREEVAAGIPRERIVVGGFSQGGAVTTGFAATKDPVGGIITLSSPLNLQWKILTPEWKREHLNTTPWFWSTGMADTAVKPSLQREYTGRLIKAGVKGLSYHEIAGQGHDYFKPGDLDILQLWLTKLLPPAVEADTSQEAGTIWKP